MRATGNSARYVATTFDFLAASARTRCTVKLLNKTRSMGRGAPERTATRPRVLRMPTRGQGSSHLQEGIGCAVQG